MVRDAKGEVINQKTVKVWNATVANLTLMALGSSAPEIILSILETVLNLGGCPGELGASTIVGSAAFNLLVISGVSIYAVNKDNDTTEGKKEDEEGPLKHRNEKGVKKINNMYVFAITATFSVWAYVWLFICLQDQFVSPAEAWVTFAFMFILLALAYGADWFKSKYHPDEKDTEDDSGVAYIEYTAVEIFKELTHDAMGKEAKTEEDKVKRAKMKQFMQSTMNTQSIDKVNMDDLKKAVDGDQMIGRIKYRKQVGKMLSGARQAIAKGQIMKEEHAHAKNIAESEKNANFGFTCLHYSVSEASGFLKIEVNNKKKIQCRVRVVTIDAEAIAGDDYEKVDKVLEFNAGQATSHIEVKINDDDNWEPDEDFYVHLLDANSGAELPGKDCKTRVTIIDDDKPGQLCFEETKVIKAVAPTQDVTENQVDVVIARKNGSDGIVTVKYKTIQLDKTDNTATEGIDYVHTEGTLTFNQGEISKIIKVTILGRGPDNDEPRDDSFGIQLSDITPDGAKLSKKSFMIINIITDVESKKKQEALQQLLDKM